MAFSRTAAFRSCFRSVRPTAARPQLWRHVAQRGYASGGHETKKAGGDALWAAAGVAVTIPSCWFLLSQDVDAAHGHDDHHGEAHGKEHAEEAKEESTDDAEVEEKSDEGAEKEEDSEGKEFEKEPSEEKPEESDSDDEKAPATPETSDDEGDEKNVKKHIPDAKGGAKTRLESKKGITAGEQGDEESGDGPSDKAAASKEAGDQNSQSGKQEGLTNTDTKHSTDITNDPSKSKKSEGAPETAKVKGTVDPERSQV